MRGVPRDKRQYLIVWEIEPKVGLAWRYIFTAESDRKAHDLCKQQMHLCVSNKWGCKALQLWGWGEHKRFLSRLVYRRELGTIRETISDVDWDHHHDLIVPKPFEEV